MSILFATPCYGGMVTAPHFRSCMNTKEELTKQGIAHDWLIGWNESLITRARNEMAATFLTTDYSHLCFIDADIEFGPADIAKLWNLQADIAVGLYQMKKIDAPLSAWRNGKMIRIASGMTEPFAVDYAGTGFFMINRKVLDHMAPLVESYEGPNGRVSAFFMTPIHDDGFESEDFHFCRRVREEGFTIVADPSIRLKHYGQFAYGA